MNHTYLPILAQCCLFVLTVASPVADAPTGPTDPTVHLYGEMRQWHPVALELKGPLAHEADINPNPFTDYDFRVTFTHASGEPSYTVPGYFAADGNAAESSANAGNRWRANLSPDKPGEWTYRIHFAQGWRAALGGKIEPLAPWDGLTGRFVVAPMDKKGRDFRSRGRLQYVGERYLRFAGSGDYFLKAGPDAPETLLGYADIDGTQAGRNNVPLKTWAPHASDWQPGDPTWQDGRGKGLIGALNYLAEEGMNNVSFLTYNAGGDGDNVWPFIARDDKLHYDVSKLDQWEIVFAHAQSRGIHLHFKLQENEIDDDRVGSRREPGAVPEALDGGKLGPERKLYLREMVARFGHHLALNWNLGEENTQTPEEIRQMAAYLREIDPYGHPIVIHSFPGQQDEVYLPLLGDQSELTGASLQNAWYHVHELTLKWIEAAEAAGKTWVVANDEQGPATAGVPPDPGYEGFDGVVQDDSPHTRFPQYDLHDIRQRTLWGNLMAGGAGVEYYFGYKVPQNDLLCEDFRSRDRSWDYCRFALEFFHDEGIPFWRMANANTLTVVDAGEAYGFAAPGELYLVYLLEESRARLDLREVEGDFELLWFNPRKGGSLVDGTVTRVRGGAVVSLGIPPEDPDSDWLAVVRLR